MIFLFVVYFLPLKILSKSLRIKLLAAMSLINVIVSIVAKIGSSNESETFSVEK